jgi:hypothetical protein
MPIKLSDNYFQCLRASKKLLGEQAAAFEIELRRKLNELADGQNFIECVQFSAYMLSKQM